jgi:hypothetical protein
MMADDPEGTGRGGTYPEGCVELEQIAALAEGRLTGSDRDRLVGHLAGCTDCREVLAGTVEVLRDVRESATPAGGSASEASPAVLPVRGERGWIPSKPMLSALAAGLAIVGGLVAWPRLATPSPPDAREWVASLAPAERLVPHVWGGVVMRGSPSDGELSRQSAELGALLVDLEVTLSAGDFPRTTEMLRRIASRLEAAGLLEAEVARLRTIARAEGAELPRRAREALPEVQEAVRHRFVPFYLDLGAFAEEARLAALAGHGGFFDERRTRRYVSWLLAQRGEPLSPPIEDALRTLREGPRTSDERVVAASTLLRETAR